MRFVCAFVCAHTKKTNLQCQVCRKKDKRMISADNLSKKFLIFFCGPDSARFAEEEFFQYQFQQGNSLLIRKKLLLKNMKFSCVEGVSGFF